VTTIIGSFWIGRWSGFLIHLLVGILYVACGVVMTQNPVVAAVTVTALIAVSFVVLGIFRVVAALVLRFPQGLGAAERRNYALGRPGHLPTTAVRRPMGHRALGRPGNAVQRMDLDHARACPTRYFARGCLVANDRATALANAMSKESNLPTMHSR
jgi:hypothetical protein